MLKAGTSIELRVNQNAIFGQNLVQASVHDYGLGVVPQYVYTLTVPNYADTELSFEIHNL